MGWTQYPDEEASGELPAELLARGRRHLESGPWPPSNAPTSAI